MGPRTTPDRLDRPPPAARAWLRPFAILTDALLPQTCVVCNTWIPGESGLACPACAANLRAQMERPACPRCGRTLPTTAIHEHHCARCRTERHWNTRGLARVAQYDAPLRRVILGLKYRGAARNATFLARLLATAIRRQPWAVELDVLVPVPMHWLRRLQRPCDHAAVLTAALARELKLPTVVAVRRRRYAPSQTGLQTRQLRFDNVRDSFAPRPRAVAGIADRAICIVDNLVATGATVHEVAKALRAAGAKRIYAATVARPPAPGDPHAEPGGRE